MSIFRLARLFAACPTAPRPQTRLGLEPLADRIVPSAVTAELDKLGTLWVTGDDGANRVFVQRSTSAAGRDMVMVATGADEGRPIAGFPTANVRQVVFRGNGGDDWFANNTTLPSEQDGGAGNDILVGGTGRDELHGGTGDDILWGRGGVDLLSGGAGRDALNGGRDGDVFVGSPGDMYYSGARSSRRLAGGVDEATDLLYRNDDLKAAFLRKGDAEDRVDKAKVKAPAVNGVVETDPLKGKGGKGDSPKVDGSTKDDPKGIDPKGSGRKTTEKGDLSKWDKDELAPWSAGRWIEIIEIVQAEKEWMDRKSGSDKDLGSKG